MLQSCLRWKYSSSNEDQEGDADAKVPRSADVTISKEDSVTDKIPEEG